MTLIQANVEEAIRTASLYAAGNFGIQTAEAARTVFTNLPDFSSTPLLLMTAAAQELGIGLLALKDERSRLNLGSFKGLGGAYAVFTLAAAKAGVDPSNTRQLADFVASRVSGTAAASGSLTVTTATAGNHGRSVAAGAKLMGIQCVVFVYDGVPDAQIEAIATQGAEVIRVDGVYEDAVRESRVYAEREGWEIVSDTSWEGYTEIPARIMEGYTVMAAEAFSSLDDVPTHIMLQAGVGGLAAAVAAHAALVFGEQTKLIIVEPEYAACLFASAQAGMLTTVTGGRSSNMGRLDCYTPSLLAWEILRGLANAFVTVSDADALAAAEMLHGHGIDTSPSGAAGVAGLLKIRSSCALGIGPDSRILAFITESAPTGERAADRQIPAGAG